MMIINELSVYGRQIKNIGFIKYRIRISEDKFFIEVHWNIVFLINMM